MSINFMWRPSLFYFILSDSHSLWWIKLIQRTDNGDRTRLVFLYIRQKCSLRKLVSFNIYFDLCVVTAVLLNLRPKLYQSRYNLSTMKVNQDTIHQATYPWTINATITGRHLGSYQAMTQARNATQGHTRSYQTSYYLSSKCHTGMHA